MALFAVLQAAQEGNVEFVKGWSRTNAARKLWVDQPVSFCEIGWYARSCPRVNESKKEPTWTATLGAAQNAGRRTPESTLHLMSLVGGWPGALIAQMLLRRKTRKLSFLVRYWFTVIVNCIALGVIVGKRVSPVKVLLGAATQRIKN